MTEFKPTVSKPAPFERPAVALATARVFRKWKTIPAHLVQPGDTVSGRGLVEKVQINGHEVVIEAGDWPAQVYDRDDLLFTFTEEK